MTMENTLGSETTADDICARFDKKSPFAFLSAPDADQQVIVGLAKGNLEFGRLVDIPEAERMELIDALRKRRCEVCDIGYGNSLSPASRAAYANDRTARKAWFDIPYRLKRAFVAWAAAHDGNE